MNKVTIKGTEFALKGELISLGATLDFKAKNRENKDVNIKDIKGKKVLSIFPDINTSVCDMQTVRMSQYAIQAPHIHFISITMDTIEVINLWCAQKLLNLDIWSDAEYNEFGNLTNTLIPAINKLTRGFIILDEQNQIIDLDFVDEVSSLPNFALVEKYL